METLIHIHVWTIYLAVFALALCNISKIQLKKRLGETATAEKVVIVILVVGIVIDALSRF